MPSVFKCAGHKDNEDPEEDVGAPACEPVHTLERVMYFPLQTWMGKNDDSEKQHEQAWLRL